MKRVDVTAMRPTGTRGGLSAIMAMIDVNNHEVIAAGQSCSHREPGPAQRVPSPRDARTPTPLLDLHPCCWALQAGEMTYCSHSLTLCLALLARSSRWSNYHSPRTAPRALPGGLAPGRSPACPPDGAAASTRTSHCVEPLHPGGPIPTAARPAPARRSSASQPLGLVSAGGMPEQTPPHKQGGTSKLNNKLGTLIN